jgi:hypothetical protein
MRDTVNSLYSGKGPAKNRMNGDELDQPLSRQGTVKSRRGNQSQKRLYVSIDGLKRMPENCVYAKIKSYVLSSSGQKVPTL